jgi:hypothetical protein
MSRFYGVTLWFSYLQHILIKNSEDECQSSVSSLIMTLHLIQSLFWCILMSLFMTSCIHKTPSTQMQDKDELTVLTKLFVEKLSLL